MSYIPENIESLFEYRRENEIRLYSCLVHPDKIQSTEALYKTDKRITDDIKEAEQFIQLLKQYRQMLFERSRKVSAAVYTPVLKFWRKKNYCTKKVSYHLSVCMRCSDPTIADQETLSESFPGTARREAFRRFEELKKAHSGILVEQHTSKESWET